MRQTHRLPLPWYCRRSPTPYGATWLAAFLALVLFLGDGSARAAAVTSSDLPPSQDDTPILTLQQDGEQRHVSRAKIESLGLHEVSLLHFEGLEGRFAGVWLDDFLAAQGLDEASRLRFIAHDDYTVFLSPKDRAAKRYLLVTRLDGEPLTRDNFGPTLLVVPADAEAVAEGSESMTRWIWSIREIHAH
ncbi:molybdopterin-dependent oxidoreductase [Halomonas sp. NO4]|uniref:molybdopterin-dependent oxidoreductase n=1 Tax=Halomonas sp. NO4 TaxID=2484813 RepID=UPI0013D3B901|nr:molybdopterin-dependent oxidoreductase [Halomonas sp. NO4]